MKSIRLNIRANAFDGKTAIPSSARVTYNSTTASHDLLGQGTQALGKFGVLRMTDLVGSQVIAATDHVYVAWVGHSGQAGVTSLVVRCYQVSAGKRVAVGPARECDPSANTGPITSFGLRPGDELTLTSNGTGDQIVSLALLVGTAVEVENLLHRQ